MTTLVIGSYNMRALMVRKNPEGVFQDLKKLMETCHVVGLQEGGDARPILKRAERELGVKVFYGFGERGQAATPIIYRGDLKFLKARSYPLTDDTFVGDAGAGAGDTMKAKWLNCVKFNYNGRWVWVANMHTAASIYIPVRFKLAVEQFTDASRWMGGLHGLVYLTGDLNSRPEDAVRNPLEKKGFRSTQLALGEHPTHGRRAIDDVYFRLDSKRNRPKKNRILRGVSDHMAYIAEFEIIPRRLRRR